MGGLGRMGGLENGWSRVFEFILDVLLSSICSKYPQEGEVVLRIKNHITRHTRYKYHLVNPTPNTYLDQLTQLNLHTANLVVIVEPVPVPYLQGHDVVHVHVGEVHQLVEDGIWVVDVALRLVDGLALMLDADVRVRFVRDVHLGHS